MLPIILVVLFVIAVIYIFFRTKPTEIFKLNKICKNCGAKEGYFKCKECRNRKL